MKKTFKLTLILIVIIVIAIPVIKINANEEKEKMTIEIEYTGELISQEEIEVEIKLSETNKDIDILVATFEYDKDIFEKVEEDDLIPGKGWDSPILNSKEGLFMIERVRNKEITETIITIKMKVKDGISQDTTQIALRNIEAAYRGDDAKANKETVKVIGKTDIYLSSEKYKIGFNDFDNYELEDEYLYRIEKATTLETFINNINTNGNIQILKTDGTELTNEEVITTGMKLKITKDEESIELKLAVTGDLNGDGEISISDLVSINKHLLGLKELENEHFLAADINDNGNVTITDLTRINKILLEVD